MKLNLTAGKFAPKHTSRHRFTDDDLTRAVIVASDSLCRCGTADQPGHTQCPVALATLALAHLKLLRAVLGAGDAGAVRRTYGETATVLKLEAELLDELVRTRTNQPATAPPKPTKHIRKLDDGSFIVEERTA